jgi:hypothetical protein
MSPAIDSKSFCISRAGSLHRQHVQHGGDRNCWVVVRKSAARSCAPSSLALLEDDCAWECGAISTSVFDLWGANLESFVAFRECGKLGYSGGAESSDISSIGSASSTGMEREDMKVAEGLLDRIVEWK